MGQALTKVIELVLVPLMLAVFAYLLNKQGTRVRAIGIPLVVGLAILMIYWVSRPPKPGNVKGLAVESGTEVSIKYAPKLHTLSFTFSLALMNATNADIPVKEVYGKLVSPEQPSALPVAFAVSDFVCNSQGTQQRFPILVSKAVSVSVTCTATSVVAGDISKALLAEGMRNLEISLGDQQDGRTIEYCMYFTPDLAKELNNRNGVVLRRFIKPECEALKG